MKRQGQKKISFAMQVKQNRMRVCFVLLSLGFPAALWAQVNTIVRLPVSTAQAPSFKVTPQHGDILQVTATATEAARMSFLQFDLSSLPPGINIRSAELRLTLAADPSDRNIVVVHRVLNDNLLDPKIAGEQIASRTILRKELSKDSTITFRDLPIDNNALVNKKFTIRLSTTYRNGGSAFYSSSLNPFPVQQRDTAFMPRLVIRYTPPPAPLTWGGYRADAQHTSRSSAIFAGDAPSVYAAKQVWQANNNIKKNMLLYKDKIYVVAQDGASSYHLYKIDPVTKTVIPETSLHEPTEMGAIDPYGRYYHITADAIGVLNLGTTGSLTPVLNLPGETIVVAPPTIGPDGTFYLATSTRGTYFSVAAYAPYPRHDLLWRYAVAGKGMGSVTLSNDGLTAYVLAADDSLKVIAINTVSGQGFKQSLGKVTGTIATGKMAPVINNQGRLFITDNFPAGNHLYVLNSLLEQDTLIQGTDISQPVVDGDGAVYYVNTGKLMKYRDQSTHEIATGMGKITSMIADAGNNIYCWNADNQVTGYDKEGKLFFTLPNPLKGMSREWDLVLAPDGSLYTGTTTGLFAIRPFSFQHGVYNLTKSDLDDNNRSFRAYMIIVDKGLDFRADYTFTLIGTKAISMKNTLKKGSSAQLVSGGTIALMPGFTVEKGAQLSCKTGY